MKPFIVEKMKKLDRIPCASVLVRINMAPMTEDGMKAYSTNDVAQKDWERAGGVAQAAAIR